MKEIPLTKGLATIVDDDDFDWLMQWKWSATQNRHHTYYARRTEIRPDGRYNQHMHRLILKAPKDVFVDHIDGDGLNNTRTNLRLADGTAECDE